MMVKVIALAEIAAFYSFYFTKMLMQRKVGIQTDQMGKNKSGIIKYIELMLKTITYIVPIVQLYSLLFRVRTINPGLSWASAASYNKKKINEMIQYYANEGCSIEIRNDLG